MQLLQGLKGLAQKFSDCAKAKYDGWIEGYQTERLLDGIFGWIQKIVTTNADLAIVSYEKYLKPMDSKTGFAFSIKNTELGQESTIEIEYLGDKRIRMTNGFTNDKFDLRKSGAYTELTQAFCKYVACEPNEFECQKTVVSAPHRGRNHLRVVR